MQFLFYRVFFFVLLLWFLSRAFPVQNESINKAVTILLLLFFWMEFITFSPWNERERICKIKRNTLYGVDELVFFTPIVYHVKSRRCDFQFFCIVHRPHERKKAKEKKAHEIQLNRSNPSDFRSKNRNYLTYRIMWTSMREFSNESYISVSFSLELVRYYIPSASNMVLSNTFGFYFFFHLFVSSLSISRDSILLASKSVGSALHFSTIYEFSNQKCVDTQLNLNCKQDTLH